MLRKMLFTAALGSLLISVSGCNTVKGVGRDIQSVGQSTQDAINGH